MSPENSIKGVFCAVLAVNGSPTYFGFGYSVREAERRLMERMRADPRFEEYPTDHDQFFQILAKSPTFRYNWGCSDQD
jgi:hypothetical protein